MKLVSFYEHQYITYADMGILSSDQVWEALEKFLNSTDTAAFQIGRHGIKAAEYVGVIQVGDISFQILPKIDGSEVTSDKPSTKSAVQNLLFFLTYAYDLQIKAQDVASMDSSKSSWFEILTRLFAGDLHHQIETGMPYSYLTEEGDLPVMRGRWDIGKQILHPYNRHTFDVIYDEFSPDIAINQIFLWVIERLLEQTLDDTNAALLGDLRNWYNPVTRINQNPLAEIQKVHFSRLNDRFEPAFQLACLFMASQTIQLKGGRQKVFSFLLDMNVLFERFLTRFLIRHQQEIFSAEWQEIQILPQSEGTQVYLAALQPDGREIVRLRPDITFFNSVSACPLLIVDAKYKLLKNERGNLNLAESDLYQMLAYSIQFDCPQVMLFYPETSAPIRQQYKFNKTQSTLEVNTINISCTLENPAPLINELRSIFQLGKFIAQEVINVS